MVNILEASNVIRLLIKASNFFSIIMARHIVMVMVMVIMVIMAIMAIMVNLFGFIRLVMDPYFVCLFKYF